MATKRPTIIVPPATVPRGSGAPATIQPPRTVGPAGDGNAKILPPHGQGSPNNLTFNEGPHNIPARVLRPGVKGYNLYQPVVHIRKGTVVQGAAGLRRSQSVEDALRNIFDAHHYADIIEQTVNVTESTGPAQQIILPAPDGKRNWLMFRNSSATANVYIGCGEVASANSTIKIAAGEIFLFDTVIAQNDLYAWADAAGATLSFQYSHVNY